jgi:hypothetical protein
LAEIGRRFVPQKDILTGLREFKIQNSKCRPKACFPTACYSRFGKWWAAVDAIQYSKCKIENYVIPHFHIILLD